jgi:hypothetical protein
MRTRCANELSSLSPWLSHHQVNLLDKKDADADFITQTLSLINSLISSPGTDSAAAAICVKRG